MIAPAARIIKVFFFFLFCLKRIGSQSRFAQGVKVLVPTAAVFFMVGSTCTYQRENLILLYVDEKYGGDHGCM